MTKSMLKLSDYQLSEPITIRLIKTEADYEAALAEVEQMMEQVELDTTELDKLNLLVTLIEGYEDIHYPMGEISDPISIIEFVMDQLGMSRKDLEQYIGPRQRVWDILERQRPLSLSMIRRLSAGLNIPSDLLLPEYEINVKAA